MSGSTGQYTQCWFPWVGEKSNVGGRTPQNSSAMLGMGQLTGSTHAQNDEFVWDLYLDSVTWKIAQVYGKASDAAIHTHLWDGSSVGTIDAYAATSSSNNYSEITGISITTAKAASYAVRAASKNASSTGYIQRLQSLAWLRTGGTASTPAGADTPGYTHELVGWMGMKTDFTGATRNQNSGQLGGGHYVSDGVQNRTCDYDLWMEGRTYKLSFVGVKNTDAAIHKFRIDGASVGTVDMYSGSTVLNNYAEVTTSYVVSTAGVKTHSPIMDAKNASSSAYTAYITSLKWISTSA